MENMSERALRAARRYVERRGYEVLDADWADEELAGRIDLVADDGGTVVFIGVTATDHGESGFVKFGLTREQSEVLAARWLGRHLEVGEVPIRFDGIDMIVVNGDKALLRHHFNRFGSCEAVD